MAPMSIDEQSFATQETLDLSKPQGTKGGLPVVQIPHAEYPRCVYKHPNQPFRVEEHRNVNHEIVHREVVATEHRVHVVQTRAEHQQKLAEGWKNEPYISQAPPDPTDDLYDEVVTESVAKRTGKAAEQEVNLDTAAAQKLLVSRGYTCETPEDALSFFRKLKQKERISFLADLAKGPEAGDEGEGE